ncbi:HAD-IA family hydrolase [Nocardioidaceae bacterium]|nr:HAD-IA family hydrolase [Nocardioidaceae bacterium]
MTSSPTHTPADARIRTVLFDCDGVLQAVAGGRGSRFHHVLSEDESDELEDLIGEAQLPAQYDLRDFHEVITGLVTARGWDVDPEEIVRVHVDIELHEPGHEIRAELRDAGVHVGIATNQHRRRAEHMRTGLGYDDMVDVSFYSCDLGYAKPDPRFFGSILEQLDQPGEQVLFIDDRLYHVESARSVGLNAVHWHYEDGADALRRELAAYDLPVEAPAS